MDFILAVGLLALFIYCAKLSDRVRECEFNLKIMKKALLNEKQQMKQEQPPEAAPLPPVPPVFREELKKEEISQFSFSC